MKSRGQMWRSKDAPGRSYCAALSAVTAFGVVAQMDQEKKGEAFTTWEAFVCLLVYTFEVIPRSMVHILDNDIAAFRAQVSITPQSW